MSESDDPPGEGGNGGRRRYTRRLSDKILIAFHQACDQADFEVAEQLLVVVEAMLKRNVSTTLIQAGSAFRLGCSALVAAG